MHAFVVFNCYLFLIKKNKAGVTPLKACYTAKKINKYR
jgi:hypothetical protein